jgi:PAS domain S-box-containing protein
MESKVRSDEEIEKRLHSLELVLQTMDAGLWEWDRAAARLHFDDRCSLMLGYSKQELKPLMLEWDGLVHPDDLEELKSTLKNYLKGQTAEFRLEYRCLKKTGDWLWVQSIGKTVEHDSLGIPVKTVGTQLDINKSRVAEIGLREYQENLERMMLNRTRELEDAQSELINKAIEAGRSQLSSMVLHNIGNAITPVKVHVEEMISDELLKVIDFLEKCYRDLVENREKLTDYVTNNDRGKEVFTFMGELIEVFAEKRATQLERITKIDKAINYISEILVLQQAYAARETDTRQQVNLNLLLEDALYMQVSALEKRQISLKKEISPLSPELVINKNRLVQVMVNIIKNGYEAIDELNVAENRTIKVGTFCDQDKVGFEIEDNGIGIEPEKIPSLFEFGKSEKGSTGIGLYYCKAFVEKNHGKLVFTSPGKGKGARVRVEFNREQQNLMEPPEQA